MELITIEEYAPLAVRTLNNLGSRKANLVHMGLGLGSEILELELLFRGDNDDTVIGELGDCYWFAVSAMHLLGEKPNSHHMFHIDGPPETALIRRVCKVVDLIKKHYAYGTPIIDNNKFGGKINMLWINFRNKKFIHKKELVLELNQLLVCLKLVSESRGLNYRQVLENNIVKLIKRYPNGYSDISASRRLDKDDNKN